MVEVKICGITNADDALAAIDAGAAMLGFVFAESPRHVTPVEALSIINQIPSEITTVGVFVNEALTDVRQVVKDCGMDLAQFHGDESPEYCRAYGWPYIKAVKVAGPDSLLGLDRFDPEYYLLDSYSEAASGGTGQVFDWDLAVEAAERYPVMLAGGLRPDNVARSVRTVKPAAVDVSTGVEVRPGRKDMSLITNFFLELEKAGYR
jgi:phosphoribosylanthranilate isomerase